ncbi:MULTISPECIES: hypothetical protein [unclassified Pantoea]|uniref:hypothetical protein n=1 Tax=unclassified Pantoea TaxID=2630326 RepID=UPI003AB76741
MDIDIKRSTVVASLFFAAMNCHAASIESEVYDTDTVIIGARAEKVTLRVTGYKNLKETGSGGEAYLGYFIASTSSIMGELAVTLAPEHEAKGYYQYGLTGILKNENGDSSAFIAYYDSNNHGGTSVKEINGSPWILNGNNRRGYFLRQQSSMAPGVYLVTMRAALYQQ